MLGHQSGKRAFWKSGLFWTILILVTIAYLVTVRVEETAYEKSKGQWTTYTSENSPLKYDPIRILTTDEQGRLWVGTEWGLYVIEPNGTWKTFTKKNSGLSSDNVRALAVDKSGEIWVAAGGLHVLHSNGQWTTFQSNRDWEGIYDIIFDSQNRMWVATFGGVIVFDASGNETIYTKENSGLIDNSVKALAIDRFGRMWIGTFGQGVSVLDNNDNWFTYQEDSQRPSLEDDDISTFLVDQQNRVWIGTGHGIKLISPEGTRTSITGVQWGIAPSSIIPVWAFALDKQERLWVGISGRLIMLEKNGDWTAYTHSNSGLPGSVFALTIDGNNKLWIGTSNGLSVLDLQKELPETVPNSWLVMRSVLRTPLMIASIVGGLIFLPVAFEFYSFWYILLLILIIPAMIGIRKGHTQKNSELLYVSILAFILIIGGLISIWFLSALISMMN